MNLDSKIQNDLRNELAEAKSDLGRVERRERQAIADCIRLSGRVKDLEAENEALKLGAEAFTKVKVEAEQENARLSEDGALNAILAATLPNRVKALERVVDACRKNTHRSPEIAKALRELDESEKFTVGPNPDYNPNGYNRKCNCGNYHCPGDC